MIYRIDVIDRRGRVIAHEATKALGWLPKTPLNVRERRGLVLVASTGHGKSALTNHGHLYVPTAIRRWCGLDAGSRVLVAADPVNECLIIHPLATLDAMFRHLHADLIGGGAS